MGAASLGVSEGGMVSPVTGLSVAKQGPGGFSVEGLGLSVDASGKVRGSELRAPSAADNVFVPSRRRRRQAELAMAIAPDTDSDEDGAAARPQLLSSTAPSGGGGGGGGASGAAGGGMAGGTTGGRRRSVVGDVGASGDGGGGSGEKVVVIVHGNTHASARGGVGGGGGGTTPGGTADRSMTLPAHMEGFELIDAANYIGTGMGVGTMTTKQEKPQELVGRRVRPRAGVLAPGTIEAVTNPELVATREQMKQLSMAVEGKHARKKRAGRPDRKRSGSRGAALSEGN